LFTTEDLSCWSLGDVVACSYGRWLARVCSPSGEVVPCRATAPNRRDGGEGEGNVGERERLSQSPA